MVVYEVEAALGKLYESLYNGDGCDEVSAAEYAKQAVQYYTDAAEAAMEVGKAKLSMKYLECAAALE